jgi:hypothetical protein
MTPLQRQYRLSRQAQFIGHSHTNAPVADVQAEISRLRGRCQTITPAYQLKASL